MRTDFTFNGSEMSIAHSDRHARYIIKGTIDGQSLTAYTNESWIYDALHCEDEEIGGYKWEQAASSCYSLLEEVLRDREAELYIDGQRISHE